jgi:hypothetical protein
LPGPLFKGGTSLSKVYKVIERFSEDVDIVLDSHALGFTGDQDAPNIAGTNKRNRKLDELASKCSETVQGTILDELQQSFRSVLGRQVGRSMRIRPTPTGRASCSPTRSAWKRICMGWAPTFVPSFGLSLDAEGMCGPLSSSRSSRTLLMHFPVSWLERPRKSTFFVLNAHFGRRPRYSMLSSIRARCRPASRGTTMTSPVCTSTTTVSLRSRTSVCWQAL